MELLKTLYRDDTLIAIDKPCGLLVHRSRVSRDHVAALQLLRDQIGKFVYPLHRLDRPTSGVLLFALNSDTAAQIKRSWDAGEVDKKYLAIVRGSIEDQGLIDWPMRESKDHPPQEAQTSFRCIARAELDAPVAPHPSARYSLVETTPHTGRMHQIRKHMKHLSHPIVGDTKYGDRRHNIVFEERFEVRRLMLFAQSLSFQHPHSGERIRIRSELPESFKTIYTHFGWDEPQDASSLS